MAALLCSSPFLAQGDPPGGNPERGLEARVQALEAAIAGLQAEVLEARSAADLAKRTADTALGNAATAQATADGAKATADALQGDVVTIGEALDRLRRLDNVSFVATGRQILPPDRFTDLLSTSFETTVDGKAVVSFYGDIAQTFLFSNTGVLFRLLVDGVEVIPGNRVRHDFESADRDVQMVGFDWVVELAAGQHTITVQWVAIGGPDNATIDSRSLIVRHAD